MFAPKKFRRNRRALKMNRAFVSIAPELLAEERRRRIEMIEREKEVKTRANLPGRTLISIRIKLFFRRIWIKIQKQ